VQECLTPAGKLRDVDQLTDSVVQIHNAPPGVAAIEGDRLTLPQRQPPRTAIAAPQHADGFVSCAYGLLHRDLYSTVPAPGEMITA
jgi:hypothetical protein